MERQQKIITPINHYKSSTLQICTGVVVPAGIADAYENATRFSKSRCSRMIEMTLSQKHEKN